jgi:hypothetical protein
MAATIGHLVGKEFRRDWPDCRVLLAAGAGAGLATAFNAPIAGAIFVLEELVRRFELRVAIAALGAPATAISVSRVLLGDAADFHIGALAYAGAATRPLYFALGAVAGLMPIVSNSLDARARNRSFRHLMEWGRGRTGAPSPIPSDCRMGSVMSECIWTRPIAIDSSELRQGRERPNGARLLTYIRLRYFSLVKVSPWAQPSLG